MLDRPRILTPPAVDETSDGPEAMGYGPGVLAPDKEIELPEHTLDGP